VKTGRYNVGVGLLVLSLFMVYGFFLIYLRDFAPDEEAWVASFGIGEHFEARLAHVHGNLFAFPLLRPQKRPPRPTFVGLGSESSRDAPIEAAGRKRLFRCSDGRTATRFMSMTAAVALAGGLVLRGWTDMSAVPA
jgi:hypothetical protein